MCVSMLSLSVSWAVKVVTDVSTKKSKGYAFIQYTDHDDAMQALESMDHQVYLLFYSFRLWLDHVFTEGFI